MLWALSGLNGILCEIDGCGSQVPYSSSYAMWISFSIKMSLRKGFNASCTLKFGPSEISGNSASLFRQQIATGRPKEQEIYLIKHQYPNRFVGLESEPAHFSTIAQDHHTAFLSSFSAGENISTPNRFHLSTARCSPRLCPIRIAMPRCKQKQFTLKQLLLVIRSVLRTDVHPSLLEGSCFEKVTSIKRFSENNILTHPKLAICKHYHWLARWKGWISKNLIWKVDIILTPTRILEVLCIPPSVWRAEVK